jgi:hypothetical protein
MEIPACYNLHVRKDDDRRRDQVLTSLNVFNVQGDFSRVNYQSHDNSINVMQQGETVFDSAREALREGIVDKAVLKDLLDKLNAVEKANSKSGWGEAYGRFIQSAANHMTVIAPFLPAIAETITRLHGVIQRGRLEVIGYIQSSQCLLRLRPLYLGAPWQRPRADLVLWNRLVPNRGDCEMAPGDTTVGRTRTCRGVVIGVVTGQ